MGFFLTTGLVLGGIWTLKKVFGGSSPSSGGSSHYSSSSYDGDYDYDDYNDEPSCGGRSSYQGHCSWHGGIDSVDDDGVHCNDGYST